METGALTLIFLLTICLILGVSLVIVIQDLFKLEKRLQKTEEENKGYKNALQKEADIVLDDAHKQAMHVVDEANRKAMSIVSSSEDYTEASKEALKTSLDAVTKAETDQLTKVGSEMVTSYQTTLQHVQEQGNEVVQNVTKNIEGEAEKEINQFAQAMHQETVNAQKYFQEKIDQEYQQVRQEVAAYKEAQIKKADEEAFQLVRFVTEQALGKGLSLEQHQSLVTEALQEAKAQGVIS